MEQACQHLEDLYWIVQRHHANILLESWSVRWNAAQIVMQDVIFFCINTEEVGEAVLDTKYWFKTTSEYSPRTASFHNQFQKVSNKILSKREGK